jgi:hypothetical protein
MTNYYKKYIKYKTKYLLLKELEGGIKKASTKRKIKERKKLRIKLAKKGYSLVPTVGFKTVSKCYLKDNQNKNKCKNLKKHSCNWLNVHELCYNKKDNIFYTCNITQLDGKNYSIKFADGEKIEIFEQRVKNLLKIPSDLLIQIYDDDILIEDKLTKKLSEKTLNIIVADWFDLTKN